jgi:hypothetical protein
MAIETGTVDLGIEDTAFVGGCVRAPDIGNME